MDTINQGNSVIGATFGNTVFVIDMSLADHNPRILRSRG